MSTQSPLADLRNTSLVPPLPTPRRLSKMSQNRHSLYSTPSSNGFEQGPLSVGASPENTPAPRPPHSRATSLLNFSFRNRTSSHPSNQAQNQTQQPLQPIRENPGAPSTGDRNTTSEFGRMSVPLGPGQAVKAVASQSSGGSPIQDQQQKPPIEPPRRAGSLMNTAQQLHPEIRSIVELCVAHAHKVYFSGPLVKHIERHSDGKIVGKEEPWRDVWAQLGGTTLSVWDMKQIEEANKRGEEVPPTYLNITDASVHVLGAVTMPDANGIPVKHSNVVTLTTAGMNLLLFSCPNPQALISWTAALRLAAYEKSRLEEIYTAHLLRMSLSEHGVWKDPRSPLVRGRVEGWVKIRISGQVDWKRMWMVVQAGNIPDSPANASGEDQPTSPRKNRMSNLFGRPSHESTPSQSGAKPYIAFYPSAKAKDKKRAVLTMNSVAQVFAVYPERPELISKSTLIKIEGFLGDEELAGEWRYREGYLLLMPEADAGKLASLEMLKWLVGLHDAFYMYGRPSGYIWNPRDPVSLMFSYPVGSQKENLFLDRELVERVDPREDRGSVVRQKFKEILIGRMFGQSGPHSMGPLPSPPANGSAGNAPTLPPIHSVMDQSTQSNAANGSSQLPQLPPLSFESGSPAQIPLPRSSEPIASRERNSLTPITERSNTLSDVPSRLDSQEINRTPPSANSGNGSQQMKRMLMEPPIAEEILPITRLTDSPVGNASAYDEQNNGSPSSPPPVSSPASGHPSSRYSQESSRFIVQSRGARSPTFDGPKRGPSPGTEPVGVRLPPESTQSPSEQSSSVKSFTNSPRPASPPPSTTIRMVPQSPESQRSPANILTSPFSPSDVTASGPSLSFDKSSPPPPPPPAKSISASPPQPVLLNNSWQQSSTQQRQQNIITPAPVQARNEEYIFDEPGALYYVHQHTQEGDPPRNSSASYDEESEPESEPVPNRSLVANPLSVADAIAPPNRASRQPSIDIPTKVPHRRQTPMGFDRIGTANETGRPQSPTDSSAVSTDTSSQPGPRTQLTRRPSGARAQPASRRFNPSTSESSASLSPPLEEQESLQRRPQYNAPMSSVDDEAVDALAALSFLEQQDAATTSAPSFEQKTPTQAQPPPPPPPPQILEPPDRAPSPQSTQYKSSFALSKQAVERKARSQAQQAAHDAVLHKPGRPNGKQRVKQREGGWESSEEEEEDEEEDDDANSDDGEDVPTGASGNRSRTGHGPPIIAPVGRNPVHDQQMQGLSPSGSGYDVRDQLQQRAVRTLPQIPRGRSPAASSRYMSDQFGEDSRRQYDDGIRDGSLSRPQPQRPQPQQLGAARQSNMWSSVLDPNKDQSMLQPNNRDTFVQLESPAETMTKAFTPQGLLSAGLQDKQDRSAKRQEELARESGVSLINVPNKPPPPQTGLLGAISAHERERNREGGMGAALTEREREKRLAEDRQRKLDDFQRQQLEQQQQMAAQGGYGMSMYGGGGLMPQMTGMNPMMSYYPQVMGGSPSMFFNPMFNPMMPNPQHMYAAQQAAQAYQQAMIAMSTAGSQVGGEGGGGGRSPNMGENTMNPGMMGGFDPRMSMMGMPMGMPMGMGMGMGMGMPQMASPMTMQMTGGSNQGPQGGFDSRFSLGPGAFDGTGGLSPSPGNFVQGSGQGSGPQSQRVSSYNSSPRGSPAPGPNARKETEPSSKS